MKLISLLTLLFLGFSAMAEKKELPNVSIVPKPNYQVIADGEFVLSKNTTIVYDKTVKDIEKVIIFFSDKIKKSLGYELPLSNTPIKNGAITFAIIDTLTLGEEGYSLSVTTKGVTIGARNSVGLFYGMQSLLQLFPALVESSEERQGSKVMARCILVRDSARFSYRGMHLDVARHFFPVNFIKKQIDILAMMKMNTFHWHLTEDQGWRIEIKAYPKLTVIGSKRVEGEGTLYEGFYTQEEIKELVKYASDRFITVIPEIELPGHALAALSAYPEHSCTGGPFKVRNVWGVEEDVYCAGKDATFTFISNILKEVVQLFPSKVIHIGGDECPKTKWKECPRCQKRIVDNNLKDEHELQSYFIRRIQDSLTLMGRELMGWDEILEGGLAPGAKVMSWRGEDGGIAAAKMGHDVVMTPGNWLYLDHIQGDSKVEPTGIGGYTTLEETYSYNPTPKELPEDKQHHIMGAQGNVWSEYMYTEKLVEYYTYPRLMAIAELTWTENNNKNFDDFVSRMDNMLERLDLHQVNYHIPIPEGNPNDIAIVDKISLEFTTTRKLPMVYTTDGTEPNADLGLDKPRRPSSDGDLITTNSKLYTGPIDIDKTTTLKIASVLPSGKMSRVRNIKIHKDSYALASQEQKLEKGLFVRVAEGLFTRLADTILVSDYGIYIVASDLESVRFNYEKPSFARYEGYIDIPEDGVYFFNTDVDLVRIAGQTIIENTSAGAKKDFKMEGSIALAKGKHKFEAIFFNAVAGGWPSAWNSKGISIRMKKGLNGEYKPINAESFFHEP